MPLKLNKLIAIAVVALSPLGCTWVEPTEEGYAVALVKSSATQNCQSLGTATAEVPDNIGPFTRSDKKVVKELITLGKNEAARMGGDTMVEAGPVSFGRQQFKVYRCK
jgi:hypothetical protein